MNSSDPKRKLLVVAFLYALLAVALELADIAHGRLVLLVAQYGIVAPFAAAMLRGGGGVARDVDRRIVIVVGVATAAAVIVIARFWDRGMLWGDETAYRVQAQIFESGRLWITAPAPTSFDPVISAHELRFTHLIIDHGHWFTKYPPGWPIVLALGELGHVRWLVNPVLAIIAVWIIHRIASRELALPTSRFAVLIVIASPFFYMMAASEMSHMLGLVCCAGAVLAFLQGVRTQRVAGLAGAIALVGLCAFVRPFTACCAAVALAPFYFTANVRRMLPRLVPYALVIGAATVGGIALYNYAYTGAFTRSPYALYRGTQLPVELTLSPHAILANLERGARWAIEDTLIFMWPGFALLAGYALWKRRDLYTRLLASFCGVFVFANLFQTEGSSSRFGDRYLFEALFAFALLAASGAALLFDRWRTSARSANFVAFTLTVVCAIQGALMIRPTLREIAPSVAVHDAVAALPNDGSLVFFPITEAFTGDRFDLNTNDWQSAPHMFLVDPGPDRRAAVALAQGRASWIVLGYEEGRPRVLASGRAGP
ncbi:MAG: hypothetical protein JWO36_4475 [Myxococcales bacterium]|nr:hypothetical protein [Myxococcales bacterium]